MSALSNIIIHPYCILVDMMLAVAEMQCTIRRLEVDGWKPPGFEGVPWEDFMFLKNAHGQPLWMDLWLFKGNRLN